MSVSVRAKRIAIIGAGPSGIAAAKYLVAEKSFDKIVVYEQRNNVGGLWQATPDLWSEDFSIPSTRPSQVVDEPIWIPRKESSLSSGSSAEHSAESSGSSSPGRGKARGKEAAFISPIYDRLETNIPRSLMRFSDHTFVDDTQLFPKHQTVQEYIEQYAVDILHLIQFRTQATAVRLHHSREHDTERYRDVWEVQTLDLTTNTEDMETFDAVVCTNGHYSTPYIPEIPGVSDWATTYPGSITHAKYYRRPEDYQGKKVLVVGNFASGSDIGAQITPYCKQPLLICARSTSELAAAPSSAKRELPSISLFSPSDRSIHFTNGAIEQDIDTVIFCTGYVYSYPFLGSLNPPLVTDGAYVHNTYQHLFYAPHPTLSLPALPQKVIPFPVVETQAAVIARLYSGRLTLPTYAAMQAWEKQRLRDVESSGNKSRAAFHALNFPQDAEYINMLYDWAASAEGEGKGVGKTPKRWGEWEFWCRERFPAIRKAFSEQGERKAGITRLDQLGFQFEEWEKEQAGAV